MDRLLSIFILLLLSEPIFGQSILCDSTPKQILAYSTATNGSIRIDWPANALRTQIVLARRIYTNRPTAWQTWTYLYTNADAGTVPLSGQYTDSTTNGVFYEYQVSVLTTNWDCSDASNPPSWAFQYIATGYQVPVRDTNGNVILLIESGVAGALTNELTILTNDLIGDGYKVFSHYVAGDDVGTATWTNAVVSTRALVKADWATDTNANWTLFIIGHVPIPYSGDNSPGSHADNTGAHPADWYYADMTDSHWTDTTNNDTTAAFTQMWNVPNDGKFDQSFVPGIPDMQVGRVDLTNMPAFQKTQVQLLQQYFLRNHQWRTKQFTVREMGLIATNGFPYEANSTFASLFGTTTNEVLGGWLTNATNLTATYLIAAEKSAGHYDEAITLGYTTNFAAVPLYVPFTTMYGSYYGDWDSGIHSNDVAQAPLCQVGYPLTMTYHENTMNVDSSAMGEPIGRELFAVAANNPRINAPDYTKRYLSFGLISGTNVTVSTESVNTYVSLMGDPTLKMRVPAPASQVRLMIDGADKLVYWWPASDTGIQGYHVYRAPSTNLNAFTRLTSVATNSPYRDTGAGPGSYTYMVRTVKLESYPTRSFYNAGAGVLSGGLDHTNYYVATNGSDSNLGTSASPFLTVQKGVDAARAGDYVVVGPGTYQERVLTSHNGSNGAPITLDGQGVATLNLILVENQYITLQNWTFLGSNGSYMVYLDKGAAAANYCVVSNNILDGQYNTNMVTSLGAIRWNTPAPGTETPWGGGEASGCLIISNIIKRISGTTYFQAFGDTNRFYGNTLIDGDAVDWWHVWGRSNIVAANICSNSFQSGLVNNHPDCFQIGGENGAGAIGGIIESNLFINGYGDCQICMLEGHDLDNTNWDLTFRNNLFVRIACKGTMAMPNVKWYNNTFIECATNSAAAAVCLIFTSAEWTGTVENPPGTYTNYTASTAVGCRLFNNIIYRCGDGTTNVGWYTFSSDLTNIQADYNFVCNTNYAAFSVNPLHQSIGAPGGWQKYSWWEEHGINGGNPQFLNYGANNFHLTASSPLIGLATNLNAIFTTDFDGVVRGSSWDIGAYEYSSETPIPEPVANFTGTPTVGAVPLTVTFTNVSTDATSYSWVFGDGATSTATNVSHIYTNASAFTVALTAVGAGGTNTMTRTGYINATNPPPPITFNSGSATVGTLRSAQ